MLGLTAVAVIARVGPLIAWQDLESDSNSFQAAVGSVVRSGSSARQLCVGRWTPDSKCCRSPVEGPKYRPRRAGVCCELPRLAGSVLPTDLPCGLRLWCLGRSTSLKTYFR